MWSLAIPYGCGRPCPSPRLDGLFSFLSGQSPVIIGKVHRQASASLSPVKSLPKGLGLECAAFVDSRLVFADVGYGGSSMELSGNRDLYQRSEPGDPARSLFIDECGGS